MLHVKKVYSIRMARGDRWFHLAIIALLTFFLIITAYPLVFVLASSFSSTQAVTAGKVFLWPVEFSLAGYEAVFETGDIWLGYRNSILYSAIGTLLNLVLTMLAAYPLSRKDLPFRRFFMPFYTFTMLFSGGMIPTYILFTQLRLTNTVWAILLSGALSVYNMIIVRSFLQSSIPPNLLEAASIDGCSDFMYLVRIVLPLSKPVIAVVALYYAIGHWNGYFNAFLYLTRKNLYPLQIFLRNILLANSIDPAMLLSEEDMAAKSGLAELMKYSLIVVSTVPVMIVYPFVRKHFVKGVMIGSLKG